MSIGGKKTCYYEVLGLDRKCDAADAKAVYRKLALKMHPDKAAKNGLTAEEATSKFQQLQEAYSVITDPQERAWYDSHRDQILRGNDGDEGADPFKTKVNLYSYFSASCFKGFGTGDGGFYAVYADLFTSIDSEEAEWQDIDSDEDHAAMPPFGGPDAEHADVSAFYRNWLDFCSRKAFGHADKWNPKDAPNRPTRRAMEADNKKARQAAKKEFNAEVRQVVRFVQKRDPRYDAIQRQVKQEAVDKAKREQVAAAAAAAAREAGRKERLEASRREQEERWAEAAAQKEARKKRGELVSDSECDEDVVEVIACEACGKTFKSEKAFDTHAKSKKHLQAVALLRRQMEREMREEAAREAARKAAGGSDEDSEEDGSEEEESEEESSDSSASESRGVRAHRTKSSCTSGDGKDGSDDDEDDFVARMAASRGGGQGRGSGQGRGGGRGFAPPPREPSGGDDQSGGSSSSSSSSDEASGGDAEEAEPKEQRRAGAAEPEEPRRKLAARGEASEAAAEEGASRRAQKKAQQHAVILEQRARKEAVQELVKKCKQKEKPTDADAGDGGPPAAAADGAADERCSVCNAGFASRSKLFQHIKATGHAALKTADGAAPPAARGRGKRK